MLNLSMKKSGELLNIYYILSAALLLRLVAAFFSKGYAATDDHYEVIGVAYYWLVNGFSDSSLEYSIRNSVYQYLHYLLFLGLENWGLKDPQSQMLVVRVLHAFLSLAIIYYAYAFVMHSYKEKDAPDKKSVAIFVAILLSFYWYFPYASVRNLVEFVCIPFLMGGFYYSLLFSKTSEQKKSFTTLFRSYYPAIIGFCFAAAFLFRFQTILIPLGMGLGFLLQRKVKSVLAVGLYLILFIGLLVGVSDWLTYGYPFASIIKYIFFNTEHRYEFITQPWYYYIVLLIVALIPPVSLFLFWGISYIWRPYLPYVLAILLFIAFHSWYPNKQERFILPIIPIIIILGSIGWFSRIERYKHLRIGWHKVSWGWFWSLNILLLIIVTPFYGQRHAIEPMSYLYKQQDVRGVLMERGQDEKIVHMPAYYMHKPDVKVYVVDKNNPLTNIIGLYEDYKAGESSFILPNYFIFVGEQDIEERIDAIEESFAITLMKQITIPLTFRGKLQQRLNPEYHPNAVINIYTSASDT